MDHRLKSWSKAASARWELRTKGLYLGTSVSTLRDVYLAIQALATHMYLYGPTGVGKTRLLLWFFEALCQVKNATVVLVNCKGELANMAFSWAVGAGLTKRLIHFPGKLGRIIGFNPLQPNGLAPMQQVKAAREALLTGFGDGVANLHQTAQLARHIFYGLLAARQGGYTIVEALDVILPHSDLRAALLPTIKDRHFLKSFSHFDNLREQRQAGRKLVLCTASDERLANKVADYLDLFDDVMASDASVNLKGRKKADSLVQHFGERGFAYAGDSRSDLAVWRHATPGS